MRIDLEFVELHSSLFLKGINFGPKLPGNKSGIKMYYDTEGTGTYTKLESVVVEYNGSIAVLDTVASRTIDLGKPSLNATSRPTIIPATPAQVAGPGIGLKSAQVEDPTRQAPKTILRRAKYQGQESQGE